MYIGEKFMKCVFCESGDTKVIDSRQNDGAIKRRRECPLCHRRFTTLETVETITILVVKNDGKRESFNPQKIKKGVVHSCEKRPVSAYEIENLVESVTKIIYGTMENEVSSARIGELVMDGLKNLDEVSYVRFASVYRRFTDVSSFMRVLQELTDSKKNRKEI